MQVETWKESNIFRIKKAPNFKYKTKWIQQVE